MKTLNSSSILLLFCSLLFLSGCIEPDEDEFLDVNEWIRTSMQENYLWNELVPSQTNGAIPPNAFFGSMLAPEDNISFITNTQGAVRVREEVSFQSGVSPAFGRFSNTNGVFAIVEFVYPDSPADVSGIKRGDIILAVDGIPLSIGNFISVFFQEKSRITYSLGVFNPTQNTIDNLNEDITVRQTEDEFNPIVNAQVIDTMGTSVGYILYSRFDNGPNNEFKDSLRSVFQNFKDNNLDELIVDLRYNRGGSYEAAKSLADAIVIESAAQNEEILVEFEYNEQIRQKIIENNGNDSDSLKLNFSSVPENLGLQRVYFLTSPETRSVSELLINGLNPFMDVEIIGEQTAGELYGTKTFFGADAGLSDQYAIVPVFTRFKNATDDNSFSGGLIPDFNVTDNILVPKPIGDVDDPVIRGAINSITGSGSSNSDQMPANFKRVKNSFLMHQ